MAAPSVQLEFGRFPLLSDAAAVAICCQQHCNQKNKKTGRHSSVSFTVRGGNCSDAPTFDGKTFQVIRLQLMLFNYALMNEQPRILIQLPTSPSFRHISIIKQTITD